MEVLRSALIKDSQKFVELDEFLESLDAPRFFDFTAIDSSRPDGPSWFCARIGCNEEHAQVDPEALDRSFKLRVRAARTPTQKRPKAPKPDDGRSTPKYARSAPTKPAAAARDRSVRAKALVFDAPKTSAQTQLSLKKNNRPILSSHKGEKSDIVNVEQLPSSTNSGCTGSKVCEVNASSMEIVENTIEFDANKENISSITPLDENFEKPNLLEKANKGRSENFEGNDIGQRTKSSKKTTKPKPFRLLTNERGIQREANLERKLNLEAQKNGVMKEAKLAHTKVVRLARDKLITRIPQCQKTECSKDKLRPLRKTPSPMEARKPNRSSRQINNITDNAVLLPGKKTVSDPRGPECRKIHIPEDFTKSPLDGALLCSMLG